MDFDSFYRDEFAAMAALARSVCGDRAAGEDIAQEALARAHQHWPRVCGYDKPGAWLRRITINLAITRSRTMKREFTMLRRKALERRDVVDDDPFEDEQLWKAVRRLPPRQRAAIALFYQEDRSTREIAEILECSVSTATSHLSDGRKRLARSLGVAKPTTAVPNQRESRL